MALSKSLRQMSLMLFPLMALEACEKNFEITAVPIVEVPAAKNNGQPPTAPDVGSVPDGQPGVDNGAGPTPDTGLVEPAPNPGSPGGGLGGSTSVVTQPPAPPVVKPVAVKDSSVVPVDKKIDILFVIDSSGSMIEEQAIVKESFRKFIESFQSRGLDFHIGVVTTDAGDNLSIWNPTSGAYKNYKDPKPGCLLTRFDEKFLSTSTASLITKFQQNADVGLSGSGREQGLLSTIMAFDSTRLADCNKDFLRDDAFLSVLVFSDENETIDPKINDYNNTTKTPGTRDPVADNQRIADFVGALKKAKGNSLDRVRLDAFVRKWLIQWKDGKPVLDASGNPQYALDSAGNLRPDDPIYSSAYQLAVNTVKNGGQIEDIQTDFSKTLATVGSNIATQVDKRHKLSMTPVGPITVTINGVVVPEDAANGWIYDAAANQIELNGLALNQPATFTLEISYMGKP
jgi:hypothetical protein